MRKWSIIYITYITLDYASQFSLHQECNVRNDLRILHAKLPSAVPEMVRNDWALWNHFRSI